MQLPQRPRLASHALARRHIVDGRSTVVLHDTNHGTLVELGDREWTLLSFADGTRDLTGILIAAAREGVRATDEMLREFLDAMNSEGFLVEGELSGHPAPPVDRPRAGVPAERPLEVLPDYKLHCDGSGGCCRIYASILFTPAETARARALRPEVRDGAMYPERVFLPVAGTVSATGLFAVAAKNGGCVYLNDQRLCSVHIAGGSAAKPDGCSLYPTSFMDDGVSIRVSVAPECGCAFESVRHEQGGPLLEANVVTRAQLHPAAFVDALATEITLHGEHRVPREQIAAWSAAIVRAPATPNVMAAFWSLADALQQHGANANAALRALAAPTVPDATTLKPWITALAARAARRAHEDQGWRSPRDLARKSSELIRDACVLLLEDDARSALAMVDPADGVDEQFFLRASMHGHHWVSKVPLVHSMRDASVRVLVGRAASALLQMPDGAARADGDPAFQHPLGLIEAILRGHGLGAYASEVPQ